MVTVYKCTKEVRCWKEHKCIGCGGKFAYRLERSVTGNSTTSPEAAVEKAQGKAVKAAKYEVNMLPCPTCGLYQPDMIGAHRARWHWGLFWITLGCLALILTLDALRYVSADIVTWSIAAIGALAAAFHLVVDCKNPNRNLNANRKRARHTMKSGGLKRKRRPLGSGAPTLAEGSDEAPNQQLRERLESPTADMRSSRWSKVHWFALVLTVLSVGISGLPEAVRLTRGWPINRDWRPAVVGPGDESRIYLPDSIDSAGGHWNGIVFVSASVKGSPDEGPVKLASASTSTEYWGNAIYSKGKSSSSPLWADVRLATDPELAGKTLELKIERV